MLHLYFALMMLIYCAWLSLLSPHSLMNHFHPISKWPCSSRWMVSTTATEARSSSCPSCRSSLSTALTPLPSCISEITPILSIRLCSVSLIATLSFGITGMHPYPYPSSTSLSLSRLKWPPSSTAILLMSAVNSPSNSAVSPLNLKMVSAQDMKALYSMCARACRIRMLLGILLFFTYSRISLAVPSFRKEGFSIVKGVNDRSSKPMVQKMRILSGMLQLRQMWWARVWRRKIFLSHIKLLGTQSQKARKFIGHTKLQGT